ncbi:DUF6531 domain-containing protein [Zooshikella ganghwensis]|uniref:Uncharacterized protein n=1 Tax=Zooshikella ganghwensis TaxID=202772 RepID=A0A4P9VJJ1_9GAMM|nr:DUF6531 domain-containing protein [Zooshikella ganghwensis]RDH41942.1 hypothetical protein B9G39_26375 [Zooshikella ganghwensis]
MNKFSSIAIALMLCQGLSCTSVNAGPHKDVAPLDQSVIDAITKPQSGEVMLYALFQSINQHTQQTLSLLNTVKKGVSKDQNFIKRFFAGREENNKLTTQIKAFSQLGYQLENLADSHKKDEKAVINSVVQSINKLADALNKVTATTAKQTERLASLNQAIELLNTLNTPINKDDWFSLPANPHHNFTPVSALEEIPIPQEGQPPAYVQQTPEKIKTRRKRAAAFEAPLYLDNQPRISAALSTAPSHTGASACYGDGRIPQSDLSVTPDVQITDEIKQLAKKLEYSPVKIFEYVSNKISFEPYRGSVKATLATLWSEAGNDIDQASLLIALLRASNVPARYVRGSVLLESKDDHLNWFQVKTPKAAYWVLRRAGIPTDTKNTPTDGNGTLNFDHVWVEACVPYANYRGDGVGKQGYQWLPMDPSYETNKFIEGIRYYKTFNDDIFLSKRNSQLVVEALEASIEDEIKAKNPNYTIKDVGDRWERVYQSYTHLPESLPYKVKQFSKWTDNHPGSSIAALPDTYRVKLHFTINDQQRAAVSLIDMTQKRVTLSFEGSTPQTQQALKAWRQGNQGLTCPNSYQVNPVIKVDGQAIPISGLKSLSLCDNNRFANINLKLATKLDDFDLGEVEFESIKPLNYHAIQAYGFQASDQYLAKRTQRLLAAVKDNTNPWQEPDAVIGEYLDVVLLKFMRYETDAIKRISQLNNHTGWSGHHIGLTSTETNINYVFNTPFALYSPGLVVDVPGAIYRTGDTETVNCSDETFKLVGLALSQYESYIWQENAQLDAVSSVSGIQIAHQQGIPVKNLYDAESFKKWVKVCSAGSMSSDCYPQQQIDMLAGLFEGEERWHSKLTIPQYPINYKGWTGLTAILYAQEGSDKIGSYLIGRYSGGYALPEMTISPNVINEALGSGYNIADEVYDTQWQQTTDHAWGDSNTSLNKSTTIVSEVSSSTGSGLQEGNTYSGDPVNMVTGNMYHQETDFSLPARGIPVVFQRHYNSRGKVDGPFGYGWTHSLNHQLLFIDGKNKDNKASSIVWVDGTGAKRFIGVADNVVSADGISQLATTDTTIPKGYYFTLEKNADGYQLTEKNGIRYLFKNVSGKVGDSAELISVTDAHGNKLQLNYSNQQLISITTAEQRQLQLSYDSHGHITQITDWDGNNYRYQYDSAGNLSHVFYPDNPDQAAGLYSYYTEADGPNVNHNLKTFTYANGYQMTFEYYADGKVYRHYNALNEEASFKYNDFRREAIFTNERGYSEHYFFNENALLIKKIDAEGGVHRFGFDDERDPFLRTSYTDPMGYTIRYHYDEKGNLVETTLASGKSVQYLYHDTFGNPGIVQDANGDISLTLYNAHGQPTDQVRFKKGFGADLDPTTLTSDSLATYSQQILSWSRYRYNTWGNLTESRKVRDFSNPQSGPYTIFEYNDTHHKVQGVYPTQVTYYGDLDGDGVIDEKEHYGPFSTEYDVLGRPIKGVTSKFYPFEKNYNVAGQPLTFKEVFGNTLSYQYDAAGSPISHQIAGFEEGQYTVFSQQSVRYDKANRKVAVSDQTGATTYYQYDPAGNVTGTTNPDGYVIQMAYNANNELIKAYDAKGYTISHTLDLIGRKRITTYPDGTQAFFEYYGAEQNGWIKTTTSPTATDPKGKTIHYEYDHNGQVVKVTDQDGRSTLTQYDSAGRAIRIVSPSYEDIELGKVRPVTHNTYNSLGHLIEVKSGYTNEAAEAAADNVTVQARYTYDDFGRKLTESDALDHIWRFQYDQHGNLISKEDANGQSTTFDYNQRGLLVSQQAKTEQTSLFATYEYDQWGQLLRATNNEQALSYRYDAAHRLVEVKDSRSGKTIWYKYSLGGKLNSITDNNGYQQLFQYDAIGRVSNVSLGNQKQVIYAYGKTGRLKLKQFPNNVQTEYHYNLDGSLKEISSTQLTKVSLNLDGLSSDSSGTLIRKVVDSHIYEYNNRGLVTQYSGSSGSKAYEYDPLDRLTKVIDYTRQSGSTPGGGVLPPSGDGSTIPLPPTEGDNTGIPLPPTSGEDTNILIPPVA